MEKIHPHVFAANPRNPTVCKCGQPPQAPVHYGPTVRGVARPTVLK